MSDQPQLDVNGKTIIPGFEDFDVSHEVGFMTLNPLERLPSMFDDWNRLAVTDLVRLLTEERFRQAVDRMPLLDHNNLSNEEQQTLAYVLLSFIGSAYIKELREAEKQAPEDAPKRIPMQLAIPWYAICQSLGFKPAACMASLVLNNIVKVDPRLPSLSIPNMRPICVFPDVDGCRWFFLITAQVELDAVSGIEAVVDAMNAVVSADNTRLCRELRNIEDCIEKIMRTSNRMDENLTGDVFYNKVRLFFSGWKNVTFEGVQDEDGKPLVLSVTGGSAAQSSTIQCYDVALGMRHDADKQKYLTDVREYMPPKHRQFIEALAEGPSIRDYVQESGDVPLKAAYKRTVDKLRSFRGMHLGLVSRFIIAPSVETGEAGSTGTGGTQLLPFLQGIRDTTKDTTTPTTTPTGN